MKIKADSFDVITRSVTVQNYIQDVADIRKAASSLLEPELKNKKMRIRLMGVRMSMFRNEVSREDMAVIDQARIDTFFVAKHDPKSMSNSSATSSNSQVKFEPKAPSSSATSSSSGVKRTVEEHFIAVKKKK